MKVDESADVVVDAGVVGVADVSLAVVVAELEGGTLDVDDGGVAVADVVVGNALEGEFCAVVVCAEVVVAGVPLEIS